MVTQRAPAAAASRFRRAGADRHRRPAAPFRLHVALLSVVLMAGAVGCAPQQATRGGGPDALTAAAADLRARGDFAAAGQEYRRLAETAAGTSRDYLLMRAADAYLDAGDLALAATVFDPVRRTFDRSQAVPSHAATHRLLEARFATRTAEWERASSLVEGVSPSDLPPDLVPTYWLERARLNERNGNLRAALLSRIEFDRTAPSESPLRRLSAARQWALVSRLSTDDWEALAGHRDARLAGWRELKNIFALDIADPERLEASLAEFSKRYPDHPANLELTRSLVEKASQLLARPERVALLLPLSDPQLEGAARVIRDGFLTAYFTDDDPERPSGIRVYDVRDGGAADAYARAVAEGAEFVVGPLTKAHIGSLLADAEFAVPALVLNHLEPEQAARASAGETEPAALYQFGLPPEEEAETVAENAWSFGYRRALTMAPLDRWGQRVVTAFTARWSALGGEVMEEARFVNEGPAYSGAVAKVLGVDASKERAKALERLLGRNLEFVPAPRDDADFLFIAARPVEARQIMPQLNYFGAGALPVLATSHVFAGAPEDRGDRDLEGIRFTDMPWMLGLVEDEAGRAFERAFAARYTQQRRLFALGVDAYRLTGLLPRLKINALAEYAGLSGRLSVDEQGVVHREPAWGRFGESGPVSSQLRPNIGL